MPPCAVVWYDGFNSNCGVLAAQATGPVFSHHSLTTLMLTLTLQDFQDVRARIAPHIKHTPLLTSRQLSELTGYDIRLKAEMFQRVGSYKIRGPLNKFALMAEVQKKRGVVCSSAGNHAQGVALAAKIHGIRPVVCMAPNATPAKIAATRA